MTDEEIIELYWARDQAAIAAADEAYGPYCHSVADRILQNREDARECVNDTWLRAWNSIPPQRPRYLRPFLAKITRNLAFDRFRADHTGKRGAGEARLALDELEECVAGGADVEDELITGEMKASMDAFLRGLPERKRDIFLRRYFYLEPASSIAGRYGLRESSVLMTLSRTRKALRRHLEKEGYLE